MKMLRTLTSQRSLLRSILVFSLLAITLVGCSSGLPNQLTAVEVGKLAPEIGYQQDADRPKVSKWEEIPISLHLDSKELSDLEQLAFPAISGGYYAPNSFDSLYAVAIPGTQFENNWYPSLQYVIQDPELGQVIANYDFQYISTRQFESISAGYIQYYGETAEGTQYGIHIGGGYTHIYVDRTVCLLDLILETEDLSLVERLLTRMDTLLPGVPTPVKTEKTAGYYLPTFIVEDIQVDLSTWPAGYIFWAFGNSGTSMANLTNMETGDILQLVYREDVEDFKPNYGDWQLTLANGYCYMQYRTASTNVLTIMGLDIQTMDAAKKFIDTYTSDNKS